MFQRKEHRDGKRTGGAPTDWPFYELLRTFLGSLPMNDDDLVEENVEVPFIFLHYRSRAFVLEIFCACTYELKVAEHVDFRLQNLKAYTFIKCIACGYTFP